jgi:hypothetical protein
LRMANLRRFQVTDNIVEREQLTQLLRGGNAHLSFGDAVKSFPIEFINTRPPNVPYSSWHLLEHLRLAQWDILEFMRDPEHVSPKWPDGYWPPEDSVADEKEWKKTVDAFGADLEALMRIAQNQAIDLQAEIPHAPGYTYLREILLVADHNAYHIGEFSILRQIMGTW